MGTRDWRDMIIEMNGAVKNLRTASPDVMKAFGDMSRAAHAGPTLDHATQELIALAGHRRCHPLRTLHRLSCRRRDQGRGNAGTGGRNIGNGGVYGGRAKRDVCRQGAGGGGSVHVASLTGHCLQIRQQIERLARGDVVGIDAGQFLAQLVAAGGGRGGEEGE
jgi:hypothetical protein